MVHIKVKEFNVNLRLIICYLVQKARGKKYGEKAKNRGVLTRAGLNTMAANLLSSYNDKFGK
jgi:hypothetical protein